ncbi:MAG: flagellar motor switch protein FliN [Gemmatimonadales bacterium]|nr:flagellar motor switch protein FliN [Gemmatimonadales bacterium]
MTTDEINETEEIGAPVATAEEQTAPIEMDEESTALLQDLAGDVPDGANLDLLLDVNLKISVELGRNKLKFREVLNLSAGSVVELSRLTSEPVDILVNGALLALGEVVVIDDHFAVRITKLLNRTERLKKVL